MIVIICNIYVSCRINGKSCWRIKFSSCPWTIDISSRCLTSKCGDRTYNEIKSFSFTANLPLRLIICIIINTTLYCTILHCLPVVVILRTNESLFVTYKTPFESEAILDGYKIPAAVADPSLFPRTLPATEAVIPIHDKTYIIHTNIISSDSYTW